MLKQLRKQKFINLIVRNVFKLNRKALENLNTLFVNHWRLSGVINLCINNIFFKMVSECDDPIVDEVYYQNIDEKFEYELFSSLALKGIVIFDIGANTGVYSLISARANPKNKIFAFEPYKPNFERFKLNLKVNGIQNVEAINNAVGAETGILNLTVPIDGRLSTVSSLNGNFTRGFHQNEITYSEIPVEITMLNNWVQSLKKVDLVKIDVETFEMEVFKGGLIFFEKFKPLIFCEIFVDEERITFFNSFIKKFDYKIYSILPEGLLKLEKLEKTIQRNFLFSQIDSQEKFIDKASAAKIFI